MATSNKRKRSVATIEPAAAAAAPGALGDSSGNKGGGSSYYRACQHLQDYRSKQGLNAFRSLQKCLVPGPPGRAYVRRDEFPKCSSCGTSSGRRLYACLTCSAICCWSTSSEEEHSRVHAQAFPGHELAVDIDRAELFCCACGDQVYDRDFDRMVLCAQVGVGAAGSSTSSSTKPLHVYRRQKKLKEAEYRPWVPSTREQIALKQGSTPLMDDSCLPSGLRGLNNMGNTCFMNSVLQALLHTPPLRNYFLSDKHNRAVCQSKASHLCLGCDMDAIFSAAFSGDRSPYSPAQLLYSWWQHAKNLAGYEQQDAHEFFISTVEGIHANSEVAPRAATSVSATDPECRCIVHRVFSGLLRSDVTCTACGFTSTTYDPCVDISLDLESHCTGNGRSKNSSNTGPIYDSSSTLLGCLDRFTRPEKLGSDERLYCQSCQVREEFIKQMSIRKLPLVLSFHIKRFEQRNYASRKVDRYIQFPLSLDMAAYLSSSIVRLRHGNRLIFVDGSSGSESRDETPTSASEFELFAVVTHSGKLDAGHYLSYLRLGREWYKCDDAWITKVEESVVRAAQAYMLYYVQKTLSYKSSSSPQQQQQQQMQFREETGAATLIESSSLMDSGYSGASLLANGVLA